MGSVSARVGVIGAGYVGLVTGVCLAAIGHDVTLRDIDGRKVAALNDGLAPIYEPGLADLMAQHADRLTYTLSLDRLLERSDLVFVAVDTPPTYSGDADLSRVHGRRRRARAHRRRPAPRADHEEHRAGRDGRAGARRARRAGPRGGRVLLQPGVPEGGRGDRRLPAPRPGGHRGLRPEDGDRVAALYEPLDTRIVRTDRAERRDGQVRRQRLPRHEDLVHQRDRQRLRGGRRRRRRRRRGHGPRPADRPGLPARRGGLRRLCFPKDVAALKQLAGNSGYHFQLLTSVIEVNELQKRRVVGKLKKHLGGLEGKRVALLGLAFKPETDDMREASSLVLGARLLAEGARVRGYDPVAAEAARERLSGIEIVDSVEAALEGADAAVLVTEWRQILGATGRRSRPRCAAPC